MAILEIPTRSDFDSFRQQSTLDGVVFTLVFKKNLRDESWTCDLLQQDGTPIRYGMKLVNTFPLLRLIASRDKPAGYLQTIDPTDVAQLPDLDQLGDEVVMLYADAAEIEGLAGL